MGCDRFGQSAQERTDRIDATEMENDGQFHLDVVSAVRLVALEKRTSSLLTTSCLKSWVCRSDKEAFPLKLRFTQAVRCIVGVTTNYIIERCQWISRTM